MWRLFERFGAQIVTFIVTIILSRILDPEVYGTIALIEVIIGILTVFVDSGLGASLIQKKDADDLDYSTIFYFNLLCSTVIYLIVFLVSPLVAKYYNNESIAVYLRVLSLILIIYGIKNIQIAYVSKHMIFKRFFYATLIGTILSAIIGIALAYAGKGIWALIFQTLSNAFFDTCILWITVKWRPKAMFSFQRLKGLFSYGWKILLSSFINTLYGNIRSLIIGKMYTSSDLAFYNKGESMPKLFVGNIDSSLNSVLFPSFSKIQDDLTQLKSTMRKSMQVCIYIIAPMVIGISAVAEPLIRVLFTEKWLPAVPYLRIFCITYMFYPLHTANLNAINAIGRSDIFLKLEIIKKIVGLIALASTMWFGVIAMAYSLLFTNIASQIINSWPNKKLLNYGYLEQLKDILPSILLSVVMGFVVNTIQLLHLNDIITLCIQVPLGVVFYFGMSKLLKIDAFEYLIETVRPVLNKIVKKEKEV